MGSAVAFYPGGTWFDRHAPGHSFWKNFLCDLMQSHALNGEEAALSSTFARVGVVALLIGLIAFYFQIAQLESPISRAGRLTRGAGLIACLLGCAVPFVPSDLFRDAHLVVVVSAFLPWVGATIAALIICLRAPGVSRWISSVAVFTLGTGGLDGLLYGLAAAQAYRLIPPVQRDFVNSLLPIFQRLAMLGLITWMLSISYVFIIVPIKKNGNFTL